MRHATIAEELRDFIGREILFGQDDGLTTTTRLLELGILDSFALLTLVAHVNDAYGLSIGPDQIAGEDFVTIDAIASMVMRRLGDETGRAQAGATAPAAAPAGSIAVFEAPACAQLFITFTGRGRDVGMDSAEFFKLAALDRRNIIVLHDPRERSYKDGVSDTLPTKAAVCAWLAAWIAERPHIVEVYCVGFSSGGPMAMIAGHHLRAKTVWALAPRTADGNLPEMMARDMDQFLARVTGKSTRELLQAMTADDRARIDAHVTPEIVQAYHESLVDPDRILDVAHLAEIVATLSDGNGVTEYRVYYVERETCDARVADALRPCPGVTLVTVAPSDAQAPTWAFSPWVPPLRWVYRDHMLVDRLRERAGLGTLFPVYRAAQALAAPPDAGQEERA